MTAGEIAMLTATVSVLTALVSSTTAVIVTLISQRLARRSTEEADHRRWVREDATRSRIRSEEMARDAVEHLSRATDYIGWTGGSTRAVSAGAPEERWIRPDLQEVATLVRPVRRAALEIDDPDVRDHLAKAASLLVDGDAAGALDAPDLLQLAWVVQEASEQRISAYLRREAWRRPEGHAANKNVWDLFDRGVWAVDELHNLREEERGRRERKEEELAADHQEMEERRVNRDD